MKTLHSRLLKFSFSSFRTSFNNDKYRKEKNVEYSHTHKASHVGMKYHKRSIPQCSMGNHSDVLNVIHFYSLT